MIRKEYLTKRNTNTAAHITRSMATIGPTITPIFVLGISFRLDGRMVSMNKSEDFNFYILQCNICSVYSCVQIEYGNIRVSWKFYVITPRVRNVSSLKKTVYFCIQSLKRILGNINFEHTSHLFRVFLFLILNK